jgi:nitrogen fixation/metabolism regulation signal transduction histidine kinase
MKNRRRQFYFSRRELQISIALIVLWSFITVIFFTFVINEAKQLIVTYELSKGIKFTLFIFVFLGYLIALTMLTSFFTKRFVGPFLRLKIELRDIAEGKYNKRLEVRKMDDPYIRSFIDEVNKILDLLEEERSSKDRDDDVTDPAKQ